jgi:arylsulfatase A-like enzyme
MAKQSKPNILIIWGDDIGWFNISANNNGIMGYKTPNIDRIAKEGANFTDWYGQQSCTAGRACFITGAIADSHRTYQSRTHQSPG